MNWACLIFEWFFTLWDLENLYGRNKDSNSYPEHICMSTVLKGLIIIYKSPSLQLIRYKCICRCNIRLLWISFWWRRLWGATYENFINIFFIKSTRNIRAKHCFFFFTDFIVYKTMEDKDDNYFERQVFDSSARNARKRYATISANKQRMSIQRSSTLKLKVWRTMRPDFGHVTLLLVHAIESISDHWLIKSASLP